MCKGDEVLPDIYPALFCSSNSSAVRFRQLFLWTHRAHLLSLVAGGLAGAVALAADSGLLGAIYAVVAACLFLGVVLLLVARAMRFEVVWFDCRAIAESAKTASWRYMAKAAPFTQDHHARSRFVAELREIREARPEASKRLAGRLDATMAQITEGMENIRRGTLEERIATYVRLRVHNQRAWYTQRANSHATAATRWFWFVFVLQVFAVIAAVALAASGPQPVDIVAILTTLAAVGVAWNRAKKNTELGHAYSLAAQELGELEALAEEDRSEEWFGQYVEQVEEAISREHTLWCARRDVSLTS